MAHSLGIYHDNLKNNGCPDPNDVCIMNSYHVDKFDYKHFSEKSISEYDENKFECIKLIYNNVYIYQVERMSSLVSIYNLNIPVYIKFNENLSKFNNTQEHTKHYKKKTKFFFFPPPFDNYMIISDYINMENIEHSISNINLKNKTDRLNFCKMYNKENENYDSSFIEKFQKLYTSIFPINFLYYFAHEDWERHQSTFWSTSEQDPTDDIDSIRKLEKKFPVFAKIVSLFFTFLKIGDDIILDVLDEGIFSSIKQPNICSFYAFQKAIEFNHQFLYTKIAFLFKDSEYLINGEFQKDYMSKFVDFGLKYKNLDIRCATFMTALTENLMFVPAFQCINYLKKLGYCNTICLINDHVMKDEHLHYKFARKLLSVCEMKLDLNIAREMLNDMCDITEDLIRKIIPEDFDTPDGLFNLDVALEHFRYVVAKFKRDNSLYLDKDEEILDQQKNMTSPAASYVCDPELNFKINYMESSSVNYKQKGSSKPIDFSDFKTGFDDCS